MTRWWDGPLAASWQVSVNSAFTWSLLLCNGYQFCSSNVWVLQHHCVHAWDMSTIIVFVYLRLQFKWDQLSSNNSCHYSCIHKGLRVGKWPDLMTSKPDSVSTLGYHWTDHTGTTLADASTQWCSSGYPERSHTYTGMPLEPHWLMLAPSGVPVAIQCSLSGVSDFFDRNKILSGGDLSQYQVPHCIRVFFYFVWFVFIHHNFQFYFELCTYCNILDIYLS